MAPVTTRSRFGAPLALLCAFLAVAVATPWSSAHAAEDTEEPKAKPDYTPQADDTDRPRDKSLLSPKPADAAVASKAQEPAFYEKWQFWAITGGIVVGAVAAIYGGITLYHSLNGGDVRPCNPMFISCAGQGH